MTTFTSSSRLLKSCIVLIDTDTSVAQCIITLQFNSGNQRGQKSFLDRAREVGAGSK